VKVGFSAPISRSPHCTPAKAASLLFVPLVPLLLVCIFFWCCFTRRKFSRPAVDDEIIQPDVSVPRETEWDEEIESLEYRTMNLEANDSNFDRRVTVLEYLTSAENALEDIASERDQLQALVTESSKDRDTMRAQLNWKTVLCNRLIDRLDTAEERINALKNELASLAEENKKLKENLEVEQCDPSKEMELNRYLIYDLAFAKNFDAETHTELFNVRQEVPTLSRKNFNIVNAELEDELGIGEHNARGEENKVENFER
jgi:chromosome segregation ATPase